MPMVMVEAVKGARIGREKEGCGLGGWLEHGSKTQCYSFSIVWFLSFSLSVELINTNELWVRAIL